MSSRDELIQDPGYPVQQPDVDQSLTDLGRFPITNGHYMLRTLGTFWTYFFGDQDVVETSLNARGLSHYQSYLNFLEAVAALSKYEVPVFHTDNWRVVELLESDLTRASRLLYGTSGIKYENNLARTYGGQSVEQDYVFPAPENMVGARQAYNRIIDPSLTMVEDQDFIIDDGNLCFLDNPFDNPLVPVIDVLDSVGNVVDRKAVLWFHLAEFDLQYVYRHFGYVLGIWMESSEFYKEFISALWDSMVDGSSEKATEAALSALTGVPLAEGNETVLTVTDDGEEIQVITERNVYSFVGTARILVNEGDSLIPGQPMVDTLQIIEPQPDTEWRQFIAAALGKNAICGGYEGPIVFENRPVLLDFVGADAEGRTVVQFKVGALPADFTKFWNTVHLEGIKRGKTLAEQLDTRVNKRGQPKRKDLPTHINPFMFLVDNFLRNNTYIIKIRVDGMAKGVPGTAGLGFLRDHLPPQTSYLIFVEMPNNDEYYGLDSVSDQVEFGQGLSMTESHDQVYDKGPRIRAVEACV